jgi:CRP/FNR family transcriptional regulator
MLYRADPLLEVLVLQNGIIKIYDLDTQGNEKILHLLKPPAIAPLAFFSGNSKTIRWFYTALTDCDVAVVPYETLQKWLHENSRLTVQLMQWFSLEVHEVLVRLSSLGKTNARGKLRAALLFLGEGHTHERHGGWQRVSFPVSHQLLADLTGLTRESVATIIKELIESGAVRQPKQTILEIKLEKLSGVV